MMDPTPQQVAQIQANVAKMRAQGRSDADVNEYLKYEEAQQQPAAAPAGGGDSILRGMGRAAMQGATFNFGDEAANALHLPESMHPDLTKAAAFKQNHPVLNFLATLAGGAAAPAAAVAAAPELATLSGAAALGGAAGLLSGAGDQDPNDTSPGQMDSRGARAATGGALGMAGGATGFAASKALGKIISPIMGRLMPDQTAAGDAATQAGQLMGNPSAVQQKMNGINALAPGGASIASATTPETGLTDLSRMTGMVRGMSANGTAAAGAESDITGQQTALNAGLERVGAKIQANNKLVPVTPEVRAALRQAGGLIGNKYVPNVPSEASVNTNPLGLEQSEPFQFDEDVKQISTNDLHDILSRLRSTIGNMQKRGIDAPGQTLHEYGQAAGAIKKVLYSASPTIATIDKQYAQLADQIRVTDGLLETVQRARMTGAGNRFAHQEPVTPGGSVTRAPDLIKGMISKLLMDKEAGPRATARFITKPGGADAVANLLAHMPATHPKADAIRQGLTAALPATMKSMFSTDDTPQPQQPPQPQPY